MNEQDLIEKISRAVAILESVVDDIADSVGKKTTRQRVRFTDDAKVAGQRDGRKK